MDNMKIVTLQLLHVEGNVVLFCNTGRTRSPMYVVVYLVIVYGMSVESAMNKIGCLLKEQRHLELDRHRSLVPIVNHIHDDGRTTCNS